MAREAIEALREQQKQLNDQGEIIRTQAHRMQAQDDSLAAALTVIKDQQGQIRRLTKGLQVISQLAGVEHKVATAMGLTLVVADVQNPAQPIPEPPAVPPSQDTVDAKTPEAMADVNAPGLVPGSTQDVAADVTTTNYTPGEDVGAAALHNLQDVTAPVAGTQAPLPINQVRTETDVRVGNPMNPQTAFPLRGDFAGAQRVGAKQVQASPEQAAQAAQLRFTSALRLARLRIQAGIVRDTTDLELQDRIVKDAGVSQDAIENEIRTLNAVVNQAKTARQERHHRLVPQPSSARAVPPLAGGGPRTAASQGDSDEELFLTF